MANIKYGQFLKLIANDINVSEKSADKYIKAVINRLFKELIRNNTVIFEYFGTFSPAFKGKYEIDEITKKPRFIADAKLDVEFNLSDAGKAFLNKDINLTEEEKRSIENQELRKIKKYKRIVLDIQEQEREAKVPTITEKPKAPQPSLEDVFNKVINQIKERNSDLLEDEREDMEEYGEEDDI